MKNILTKKLILCATALITVFSIDAYNVGADTTVVSTKSISLNTTELKVNKVIVAPKPEVTIARASNSNSNSNVTYNINRGSASSSEVVNYAYSLLGKPYVFGASGPNAFDCSGLTSYVFRQFGVNLPRTSFAQYGAGVAVSKNNLQPGDLVFFNTYASLGHVGIYIGGGEFIHASSTGNPVMISSMNSSYYQGRYEGARRVR